MWTRGVCCMAQLGPSKLEAPGVNRGPCKLKVERILSECPRGGVKRPWMCLPFGAATEQIAQVAFRFNPPRTLLALHSQRSYCANLRGLTWLQVLTR